MDSRDALLLAMEWADRVYPEDVRAEHLDEYSGLALRMRKSLERLSEPDLRFRGFMRLVLMSEEEYRRDRIGRKISRGVRASLARPKPRADEA